MRIIIVAAIAAIALASAHASRAAEADHTVTQAQFDRWKQELANWGRWGKDDEQGTLNLITPAKRSAAAALVKDGVAVSLARDADTAKSIDNSSPFEHVMNP